MAASVGARAGGLEVGLHNVGEPLEDVLDGEVRGDAGLGGGDARGGGDGGGLDRQDAAGDSGGQVGGGGGSRGRGDSRRNISSSDGGGGRGGGSRSRRGDGRGGGRGGGSGRRGDGSGGAGRGTRVESRTGDHVGGEGLVDVEEDTRVVLLVESGTLGAAGGQVIGTRASDLKVHALRVVLGTVGGASTVESNDLVAEDVLARSDAGGDGGDPGVVVGDHVGGSPGLAVNVETTGINLDELKGLLVDGGAVIAAVGKVGDDGALVRVGPGGPLNVDVLTGSNSGVGLSVGSTLVADDVGVGVGRGGDEAVVKILGDGPTDDDGSRGLVLHGRVVVLGVVAINDNARNSTVGGGGGGEGAEDTSVLEDGRHVGGLCRGDW